MTTITDEIVVIDSDSGSTGIQVRAVSELVLPSWQQQPGESQQEYSAFLEFCRLPPASRNRYIMTDHWIYQAQPQTSAQRSAAKQFIDRSYTRWRWMERASEREMWLDRQREQKWLERDMERRERDYKTGSRLRNMALKSLRKYEEFEDFKLPIGLIPKFIELASQLQESAVPQSNMNQEDLKKLMDSLPAERRANLVKLIMAKMEIEG